MQRWSVFALTLTAALILTGVAVTQSRPDGPPRGPRGVPADELVERLMRYDKNGDGKITKDELPERMHYLIELGDTNKDGALDRDEIKALAAKLDADGRPRGA